MGNLFWVDIETCGLASNAPILEVAVVITTPTLETVAQFDSVVAQDIVDVMAMCDNYVLKMHSENGLFDDIANERGLPMREIATRVRTMIDEHGAIRAEPNGSIWRSPLCGSTVSFDRRLLDHQCPDMLKGLSYRHVDVSTIGILHDLWYGEKQRTCPAHRASTDIRWSIDQLRWYKSHIFSPYGRLRESES